MDRIANSAHLNDWLGPRLAGHVSGRLGAPVTFSHWRSSGRPVFRVPHSAINDALALGIAFEASVPRAPRDTAIRQAPEHRELPPLTDPGTPEQECFDQNITEPPCSPVAPHEPDPESAEEGGEA